MSAARYDLQLCDGESGRCRADMVLNDTGDYVLYNDYAALAEQIKQQEANE